MTDADAHSDHAAGRRINRRPAIILALAPLVVLTLAPCGAFAQDAASLAFRNAVTPPPPGWTQPVFRLSRDYPAQLPAKCPDCSWLQVNVNFNPQFPPRNQPNKWMDAKWADYMARILDYLKQGQDPNLKNEIGFRTDVNGRTRWFNVPWMAYDPTVGREFVHGTTNERATMLEALVHPADKPHAQQTHAFGGANLVAGTTLDCKSQYPNGFETWSVGYYNEWGGMAVGRAFPRDGRPHTADYLGSQMPAGLPFPEGTMVMKILTTSAPPECVPYLKGSPEWQIDRHKVDAKTKKYLCGRDVQVSRVIQVDVAVVDLRSPTRWVYSTFVYDGDAPGATFWDRLIPLGVQFGADPWSFPAVPHNENLPVQQTVMNPGVKIYEHNGCEGRLAGPVDNAQSSCMSCHGSAFAAGHGQQTILGTNVPAAFGFAGLCTQYSLANTGYFQNIVPPQKFSGGQFADAMSLDTSLQLQVAYRQFGLFNTKKAPAACTMGN